jgi:hypothetical protein
MHDAIPALSGAGKDFDMIDKHARSIERTPRPSMRLNLARLRPAD